MRMGNDSDEDALIYNDPEQGIRRLRGIVEDDGKSAFVTVRRRDGSIELARALVLKIERRKGR